VFQRQSGKLTVCRLAVGIGHPRALVGMFPPVVEGANSPMMKFLDALPFLWPGRMELNDVLDQGGQLRVHQWLCSLSLDDWREHEFVLP
jgi:hypothetical protein